MLIRLRRRLSDESGVSLVESLLVVLLMSVVGGTMLTSVVKSMHVSAATTTRFDALGELQKSVDRMTRELRAAEPYHLSSSTDNRAVVTVYRNNFTEQIRFTYFYCPAPGGGKIHVRREGPSPVPPAVVPPVNCATTTEPVLIDRVVNPSTVPVFQPRTSVGGVPTMANQVYQVRVRVQRSAGDGPPIETNTNVRVRNARA